MGLRKADVFIAKLLKWEAYVICISSWYWNLKMAAVWVQGPREIRMGSGLVITHPCLALRLQVDSTGFRSERNENAVSTSHTQKWKTRYAERNYWRIVMAIRHEARV